MCRLNLMTLLIAVGAWALPLGPAVAGAEEARKARTELSDVDYRAIEAAMVAFRSERLSWPTFRISVGETSGAFVVCFWSPQNEQTITFVEQDKQGNTVSKLTGPTLRRNTLVVEVEKGTFKILGKSYTRD